MAQIRRWQALRRVRVSQNVTVFKGIGNMEVTMQIFDRWGGLIYVSNSAWDGNYNNYPAPNGVYIYQIIAKDIFKKSHTYTGTVNLLR